MALLTLFTRQQLYADDNQVLAEIFGRGRKETQNFNVIVTELCDGNLTKRGAKYTMEKSTDYYYYFIYRTRSNKVPVVNNV